MTNEKKSKFFVVFIKYYKLLYINNINYNKNINYMDEIYKWIESNCHALKYEFDVENNDNCIVKVINFINRIF